MFSIKIAGVHRYSVRIPDKAIFDHLGDEMEGLAIESRRLILISPAVQIDRREEVLRHEVQHAWEFHVPSPRGAEERAQLAATIDQALRVDLERLGGIAILNIMKPEPMSLPYRAPIQRASPSSGSIPLDRIVCGGCESEIMCGSIHTDEAEFHDGLRQHHVQRWFECETCGIVQLWFEVATSDGCPTGTFVQVPAPRMMRGEECRRWLRSVAAA
jgi:hypothetical protein